VVEHTNAEYEQWQRLQRCTGRREDYDKTHLAIAGLASDRTTRRLASTELVPVRAGACCITYQPNRQANTTRPHFPEVVSHSGWMCADVRTD
jgi:hypothetical protein